MATPAPRRTGREGALGEIEDWFVARGVPHLIDGYSATRDVLTRSVPVLSLIFVAEVLGATELEWPWWGNVLALLGGLGALLGFWAGFNKFRARPLLARPDDVGPPELALFVIAPALLPLIFGGHAGAAALTAAANLAAIGLVYLGISYGAVPLTRWAAIHLVRELSSVLSLSARALPLLLVFGVVLVVNTEVWQMSASLDTASLVATVGLFVVVGAALLAARIPREVHGLEIWDGPEDLARRLAGTPAEQLANRWTDGADCPAPPPLRRRHWANLGLVLLFAQGLQVLLVAVTVGTFFAGFGMLAITPQTAEAWTGSGLDRWASLDLGDRDLVLSGELVKVAVFIGGLAGLSFAISALTDETYRREFTGDVLGDLRQVLAVRAAYLAALAAR
ncbi:hypothetical protein [Sporichthya sp.]|uniref:hypothetical protein n=1 Tax=Sporichthya sp. TaxID=65475 RepID=UPI00184DE74D|nr:hypothetical protein [Sporichthya sp.]MBA3742144.1 hypothetical protein [Sporichthya sp.]